MIEYKDYVVFKVLGEEINLISSETAYGRSTVAEINDQFYYLDDELPAIASAIFAWQEVNNRELTVEELHQIMEDNKLISNAV